MTIKIDAATGRISSNVPVTSDWLALRNSGGDLPLPEVQKPDSLAAGHAAHWQKQAGSDDAALNNLGSIHAELSRSFDALLESRAARNPNTTQAAHLDSINRHFNSTLTRLASATDRAKESATKRMAAMDSEFRSAVRWDEKHAQELRSVIRHMPSGERSEFVGTAINERDGATLAAVLGAPPALSGITAEQQRAFRGRAMHHHTPHLLTLEKTLHTAMETTTAALHDMLERGPALTASEIRKQYAEQAERAEKARAGLGSMF